MRSIVLISLMIAIIGMVNAEITDELYVEKHIANRIIEYRFSHDGSFSNRSEIISVLQQHNYLERINNVYNEFNVNLDSTNVSSLWIPYFPLHGQYCGYYNTNYYGMKPKDDIDRYCQIYKICIEGSNYQSCFCNRQLQYSLLNYEYKSVEESNVIDNIIMYLNKL